MQPKKQVCAGASPTCDPFVPCLSTLGASATQFLHCSLCMHSPLPGFPGTSLPGSFSLPHTRTLSAEAASLFTSRVSRPATSQTQRSPAREGEAPSSGCPLHRALALGPDNPGFRSREKGHKICHSWAGIPTVETALARSPGNQRLSWREVGKKLRPLGWETEA